MINVNRETFLRATNHLEPRVQSGPAPAEGGYVFLQDFLDKNRVVLVRCVRRHGDADWYCRAVPNKQVHAWLLAEARFWVAVYHRQAYPDCRDEWATFCHPDWPYLEVAP